MSENLSKIPSPIAEAISKAMALVKMLGKSDENKFAKYKYTSIDDFLQDLRPKLAEVGLDVISDEIEAEHFTMPEVKHDKEIQSAFVHYAYNFYLAHKDSPDTYGPLKRTVDLRFVGPQTSGQAQSYCEKMFLRSLLKVATGDEDADAQEQGSFSGRSKINPVDKTGNRAVDDACKAAISKINDCVDEESVLKVGRYQWKYCKDAGATEEQLELIQSQTETKVEYLRNKNGV